MSFNKKILAAAVAAAVLSPAAMAVSLDAPNVPSQYPSELVVPATRLTLVNGANNQLDVESAYNYAFSDGEVRYVRVSCTTDVRFNAGSTVVTTGNTTAGAINGLGTSTITFSVTAGAGGSTAGAGFTVNGNRSISSTGDSSCSYSLYDNPSEAAAGTDAGRITSVTGMYLDFMNSYRMTTTATGATANVESPTTAYSLFLVNNANATTVGLGNINTDLTSTTIYEADGTLLTFGEIIGAGSKHIITGDFTSVANADGTYTGAALGRIELDPDADCTNDGDEISATSVTSTTATFNTGALPLNHQVCFTAEGSNAINEADYSVVWDVVSADPNKYTTPDIGPQALGSIGRNGTQIQAPLVQGPSGYLSRIALSNSGNQDRAYSIRVINVDGSTATVNPDQATGTVSANSTKMINVSGTNGIITSFTGAERATVIITVAAPTTQIQGLYQIVKPDVGSISNHVMVRPGTN